MKLNAREKRLVIILIVALILLIVKSSYEGYDGEEGSSEYNFYKWTVEKVDNEYNGFVYDKGIVRLKVVSIKTITRDDGDYYVAKVRKYIVGLFPFSDIFIKDKVLNY
jgi:hypothetical protein